MRLHHAFNRMLDRLEDERRQASEAVLRAQEAERARLARDLHDEANQSLTGVLLRLRAIEEDAPAELRGELRETAEAASLAMDELLRLARELRPSALDDHGIERRAAHAGRRLRAPDRHRRGAAGGAATSASWAPTSRSSSTASSRRRSTTSRSTREAAHRQRRAQARRRPQGAAGDRRRARLQRRDRGPQRPGRHRHARARAARRRAPAGALAPGAGTVVELTL